MSTSTNDKGEGAASVNPCEVAPGEFDHDYEVVDDSFDHEYGTEQVIYCRCKVCGHETDYEADDYE